MPILKASLHTPKSTRICQLTNIYCKISKARPNWSKCEKFSVPCSG